MNKGYLFIVGIIFGIILILVALSVRNKKNRAKWTELAEKELWIGEKKPLIGRHTLESVPVVSQGDSPGVSYTMNIEIEKWLHNKNTEFRELFTHGTGKFGELKSKDIASVAIGGPKNDIYIDINVRKFTSTGAEIPDECKDLDLNDDDKTIITHKLTSIQTHRIVLKYFPIAKYFHLAIVLTQNRVDAYLDGKLNVTKIFDGDILMPSSDLHLPILYFMGEPIKGHMSNFRYINKELNVRTVKDIYKHDINPNNNKDIIKDEESDSDLESDEDEEINKASCSTPNKTQKKAFCFAPNTRVLLQDGKFKDIIDVKIGDKLLDDSVVTGTMKFDATNVQLVDNVGIISTFDHHILHNGLFKKSGSVPGVKLVKQYIPYLYDIDTTSHRITILNDNNEHVIYTDFTEVDDNTNFVYQYELALLNKSIKTSSELNL